MNTAFALPAGKFEDASPEALDTALVWALPQMLEIGWRFDRRVSVVSILGYAPGGVGPRCRGECRVSQMFAGVEGALHTDTIDASEAWIALGVGWERRDFRERNRVAALLFAVDSSWEGPWGSVRAGIDSPSTGRLHVGFFTAVQVGSYLVHATRRSAVQVEHLRHPALHAWIGGGLRLRWNSWR